MLPREALEEVLPETDILILSLPGTKETRGLLDKAKLALLPDGALLINVGRGSALNEAALERELRAGRLRAALDVFEHEPLPEDSPLWGCPNLLITPHVAGNMTLPHTVERIVALFWRTLPTTAKAGRSSGSWSGRRDTESVEMAARRKASRGHLYSSRGPCAPSGGKICRFLRKSVTFRAFATIIQ